MCLKYDVFERVVRSLVVVSALLAAAPAQAKIVSRLERLDAVKRSRVALAVEPAAADLLNGPQGDGGYKFLEEVRCRYEEKDPKKPLGGHTKKFPCWDGSGRRLKVKYGADSSEVYGEVAGSRLFWALGFPAERMYSVKIVCENCPADPWTADASAPRATRVFEPATIQRKLPGEELSEVEGEGWTFDELDLVDERAGGSSKAEVDALKILSAFVNHGDNTPNQQRLLCPAEDKDCRRPLMYVTDLGATFGGKGYYTSFRNWQRKKSLWKDPRKCVLDFEGTVPGYRHPAVGEAGRRLLAERMAALSESQIRDLFRAARFDILASQERPMAMPDGKVRRPGIEDWVRVFKARRAELGSSRCPE